MKMQYERAVKVPGTTHSILSGTDKMPCPSWSLPAGRACPWAVFGVGKICDDCYALRRNSHYQMPRQQIIRELRFRWTVESLRSPEGIEEWVSLMVAAITQQGYLYFRGHDSGDFFNPAYVRAWIKVCERMPRVQFWFPTKSYLGPVMLPLLIELNALPNVTVRPSATDIDGPVPEIPGLAGGTTVYTPQQPPPVHLCPAPQQDHKCMLCRVCWDQPQMQTAYELLG